MSGLPPIRRSRRNRARVVASVAAVVFAAVLTWLVVQYASSRPDQVNLGDRTFRAGRADRLAGPIGRDGPFLFKDPLNRNRELYLQHVGQKPGEGWLAMAAYAPGAPRELRCLLRWEKQTKQFRDPCSGAAYPADGQGLDLYPAEVDDKGVVVVDLRASAPAGAR